MENLKRNFIQNIAINFQISWWEQFNLSCTYENIGGIICYDSFLWKTAAFIFIFIFFFALNPVHPLFKSNPLFSENPLIVSLKFQNPKPWGGRMGRGAGFKL